MLAWWAGRLGFVADTSRFPGGGLLDVWGRLLEERAWKFLGEAKAWERPNDRRVQQRLFEYFCQAFVGVTRRKNPWIGFRFALAYLSREDGDEWKVVIAGLITQAGFSPPVLGEDELDGVPVIFWDFPPQP